jgi:transcriptional regulator with XRE-family HTH domain
MSKHSLSPATTYPSVVGNVLAQLRKNAQCDQAQMATAVGVTQSTWSRIERGQGALTLAQLAKAATFLNISPGKILRWADQTCERFEKQGVKISSNREKESLNTGLVVIGVAAIAALVATIISKK